MLTGNFVWMSAENPINYFLLLVTIGDNSIVAAGVVVTKGVLENAVVIGVPAKFKKRLMIILV